MYKVTKMQYLFIAFDINLLYSFAKDAAISLLGNHVNNKSEPAMKKFFTNLIIITLFLTAPLSFTGDCCPDFKPDCCRSRYVAEAIAVSVSQQRTVSRKTNPSALQPVFYTAADCIHALTNSTNSPQFILVTHSGRAPPLHHSASV